jgi:hypothetical protein
MVDRISLCDTVVPVRDECFVHFCCGVERALAVGADIIVAEMVIRTVLAFPLFGRRYERDQ